MVRGHEVEEKIPLDPFRLDRGFKRIRVLDHIQRHEFMALPARVPGEIPGLFLAWSILPRS